MTTSIPPSLRAADISRFAHRASQLETAKPIIAYYCKYQVVNQILAKGLHNADQDSVAYTTRLMDELEQFKAENQTNDAVVDDVAGKLYVEQFALETFQRAENAMRANKASRQTADTFLAAATFLELLHIWGPMDAEITSKILHAKFHAVRIAKALKAGEDPNLSNPASELEDTGQEALPALDPNDADVQMLNGAGDSHHQPSVVEIPDEAHAIQKNLAQKSLLDESLHPSRAPSMPPSGEAKAHQPSVVEVPDDAHRLQSNMARQSALDESLHPSRAPSVPPASTSRDVSPPAPNDPSNYYYTNNVNEPGVSPMAPEPQTTDRRPSTGGNYFPPVPSPFAQPPAASIDIPTAPVDNWPIDLPSAPSERSSPDAPPALASMCPFPLPQRCESPKIPANHHGHLLPQTNTIPANLAPQSAPRQPLPQTIVPPTYSAAPPAPIAAVPSAVDVVVDEVAVTKAQKHARWAISALNFEDVPTAIKELRGALETLGAR